MELTIYTNSTAIEERALSVDGEIVLQGNYYDDKIADRINGFMACLDYLGKTYSLTEIILPNTSDLFKSIDFYNAEEEY